MPLTEEDKVIMQAIAGKAVETAIATIDLGAALKPALDEALAPLTDRLDKADTRIDEIANAKPDATSSQSTKDDQAPATVTLDDVKTLLEERDQKANEAKTKSAQLLTDNAAWLKKHGYGKVVGTVVEKRFAALESDAARASMIEQINAELKAVGAPVMVKLDPDAPAPEKPGMLTPEQRKTMSAHELIVHDLKTQQKSDQTTEAAA